MTLAQMESRFFELKGKLAVAQITEDDFKRELEKLRFQDAQGRWWMIGAQSGRWYFYDGARWLLGQPPEPPATSAFPGDDQPTYSAPTGGSGRNGGDAFPGASQTTPPNYVAPRYTPPPQPAAQSSTPRATTPPLTQRAVTTSRHPTPTLAERVREEMTHVHVPAVHVPPVHVPPVHTPAPIRRYPPNVILIGAVAIGLLLVALMWLAVDNLIPGKPISSFFSKSLSLGGSPSNAAPTPRATSLPSGTNVDNILQVGDDLVSKSQFEPALTQFQAAAKLSPSDADVYTHMARALALTGRIAEAVNTAQRATRLDPTSARALAELTRALAWSGQTSAAISAGEKAITLDPANATAHAFLSEAYLRAGRGADAQKEADAALSADDGNADSHRAAGWVAVLAARKSEGIDQWKRVVEIAPDIFFYHYEFGQVYAVYLNDSASAIPQYEKATEQFPPYIPSYTALGHAYLDQNQPGPAILQFQRALTFDQNSSEAYLGLAQAFQKQNRCQQAIPYFQKSLELNKGSNEALTGLAECGAAAKGDVTPVPTVAGTPGLVAVPTAIVQATVVPLAQATPTSKSTSPATKTTPVAASKGRIAFSVYDGQYHLYTANADGTDRKLIAELASGPAFSPDGSQLLYTSWQSDQRGIHRIEADGSADEFISLRFEDFVPSWAPDGTRYIYATRAGLGSDINKRAYSIRVGDPTTKAHQDPPPFVERAQYPVWGPNNKIVFRDCGFPTDTCGLAIVSTDGSGKTALTSINSTAPAWSPDGSKIAFTSDYGGNWDIYIVNASGGSPARLTTDAAEDGLPAFSPDGKQIAFLSHRGGTWAIWIMGIDGSNQHKAFDLGGDPAGSIPGNSPAQPGQVWYEQKISWR